MLFNHAGYWSLNGSACCIRLDFLQRLCHARTPLFRHALTLYSVSVLISCHPPPALPIHPSSYPLPPPPFSALTCCTAAIAEKQQQAVEQCGLGGEHARTHSCAHKVSLYDTHIRTFAQKHTRRDSRNKLTSWVLVFLEAPATKTLQHMRSFAENVVPNKPHGFGRDGGGGGG